MNNVHYVRHEGISKEDSTASLFSLIVPESHGKIAVRDHQRAIANNYFDPNRGIFVKAVVGLTEEDYHKLSNDEDALDTAIKNSFKEFENVTEIVTLLQYGIVNTEDEDEDILSVSVEEKDLLPF